MSNTKYSKAVKEFAGSEVFFKIFDETIALVQKSSDYLEGVGRFDQARLSGKELSLFASQSVRLTNRLMQTSSWLLGHRSFYKGEINEPKAIDLSFHNHDEIEPMDKLMAQLPTRLVILITQTSSLFERIVRIDAQLNNLAQISEHNKTSINHVHNQLLEIQKKFGINKAETQVV
ncbi:MAG: hypothetical protein ACJARD_001389 [Alphaproteobacteria bacterium]|jgi:hypothetical protein